MYTRKNSFIHTLINKPTTNPQQTHIVTQPHIDAYTHKHTHKQTLSYIYSLKGENFVEFPMEFLKEI